MSSFNITDWIEQICQKLPEASRTDEFRDLLYDRAMQGIMIRLMNFATFEDMDAFLTRPEVTADNVHLMLGRYIDHHPELQSDLKEELDSIERNLLSLSSVSK